MGFKKSLLTVLNVEEEESTRVFLLLGMGFFMGIFLATLSVGASTLFLNSYTDKELQDQLPLAILLSGILGIIFTAIYNFFQSRVRFSRLAMGSIVVVAIILLGIEIAFRSVEDPTPIFFFAFTFIVPSNFIVLLVFWGSFGRMFNLRQSKRIIGSIDTGQLIASIIALFAIPVVINNLITTQQLLFVTLISIVGYFVIFLLVVSKNLLREASQQSQSSVSYGTIIRNKYIALMSLFVIISMIAVNFIDYSFLSVTTERFDEDTLPKFLSLFEAAVVIFSFLFQTFVTDKIIALYGLKVSLLINPLLLGIFTVIAIPIGYSFGYNSLSDAFIFFFIIISMSKLFNASLKDALDGPAFKLYFLPVDGSVRFDVQTKIEGVITALAGFFAGGLIILINNVEVFSLIHISIFTLPVLVLWYFITNKMHGSYRETLQETLIKNKNKSETEQSEYSVNKVLEKEVNSEVDQKVIYGLKLMEKMEPALFENSVLKLQQSESSEIKKYARSKIKDLDIQLKQPSDISKLARQAAQDVEDNEVISVSSDKLHKMSKSIKSEDRILAAKLLRKLISNNNIFILLELLRDIDPKVKKEAILTASKVKRKETFTILLELLESPTFSNSAASALIEAGEDALISLEAAFHKSGQSDAVMLKIVQIMGRIGGDQAIELLWNKIEHPDKRIVKQILLSFRYFNFRAKEKEIINLTTLLENEIGKTIWNLAAITEIPKKDYYKYLRDALKEEVGSNYDTIYTILSILYDPQSVQLIKENIESGTSDGIAFAIELLDLFINPELKPKLFPLVDDITIHEKLRLLQPHFPREEYNEIQVLNYILNKNYNEINRWTKACALYTIPFVKNFRISRGLLAQLFNQDKMLQEAAAFVIYHKDKYKYYTVAERLTRETKRFLDDSIEKNQLQEGLSDGFFLRIEMVLQIKNIDVFNDIKGVILCDLADKLDVAILQPGEKIGIYNREDEEQVFIVADGEAFVKNNDSEVEKLSRGDAFGNVLKLDGKVEATHLEAFGRAVVFHLSVFEFCTVMANHHELAQGFIKNISKTFIRD